MKRIVKRGSPHPRRDRRGIDEAFDRAEAMLDEMRPPGGQPRLRP